MRGTSFVYSSHNRGRYIHDEIIIKRALEGRENKRILFLPMSETIQNGNELERQDFAWGGFRWYFDFFRKYGLEYMPFFWTSHLRKSDVDALWHLLYTSEVVILGGGHSMTGLHRYKALGAQFDGEWGKFGRLLHERQTRGLLTVGFSAGADQMCQYLCRASWGMEGDNNAFGMVRDTICTLHHEMGNHEDLYRAAGQFQHCRVFGLPNDAGLNVAQGVLPSGNRWQAYEFIVDRTWTEPSERFHVKTLQGALIEHISPWGWHWAFDDKDMMVRIQSPDGRFDESWMRCGGRMFHYNTRSPSSFGSIEQVLGAH